MLYYQCQSGYNLSEPMLSYQCQSGYNLSEPMLSYQCQSGHNLSEPMLYYQCQSGYNLSKPIPNLCLSSHSLNKEQFLSHRNQNRVYTLTKLISGSRLQIKLNRRNYKFWVVIYQPS